MSKDIQNQSSSAGRRSSDQRAPLHSSPGVAVHSAEEHLVDASERVKKGTLIVGVLKMNKANPTEAFIRVAGLDRDVYIRGIDRRNR